MRHIGETTGLALARGYGSWDAFHDASLKVAAGQEYEIAGRRLKRADASEIRQQVLYWERQVARLSGGGRGGLRLGFLLLVELVDDRLQRNGELINADLAPVAFHNLDVLLVQTDAYLAHLALPTVKKILSY